MRISAVLVAGFLMVGPACGLTVSDTPGAMSGGSEPTAPPPSPGVTPPNPAPAPPGMSPTPTNPPSPGTPPSTPPTPGTPPYPPGTPPSPPGTPPSPPGTPPVPMPPPSPPGASGPGVTINGVFIPKDKVIVTLHLGHSNAAGRTDTPPNMRPMYFETHPKLWAYAKGGRFSAAKEPLSGDRLTQGKAGPGMAILRTAMEHAPDLTFVHIGRGHDGSVGGFCRSFRKGALLYDFVMGPAMELKGKVTFAAIFTMLGVNEFRRDEQNIPRFNECMAGIASDMRAIWANPTSPSSWATSKTAPAVPSTRATTTLPPAASSCASPRRRSPAPASSRPWASPCPTTTTTTWSATRCGPSAASTS